MSLELDKKSSRSSDAPGLAAVLINDDRTQLKLLSTVLASDGFETASFCAAADALAFLRSHPPPAVIITDLYMTEVDGWTLCRMLRSPEHEQCNNVPILVASATYTGVDVDDLTMEAGANAFMPMPADAAELKGLVRRLVAGGLPARKAGVLIVDDDVELTGVLEKVFLKNGYAPVVAHSPSEALEKAAAVRPAVALVNHRVSNLENYGLLEALRRSYPNTAVLVMTSETNPALAAEWLRKGVRGYLTKPFDHGYLLESARKAHRECSLMRIEQLLERRTRALQESEQKYRELVEQANSIILRWKSDGRITFLNEFGQRFFGYSAQEIIGRHVIGTIVPPTESDGRDLRQLMERICADPKAFEQNVNQNMRRDGERVWISWTNRIVSDSRGQVAEILSVGTDITERRRAAAVLRQRADELAALNDVGRIVNANLTMERTTAAALQGMLDAVRPDLAFIFLRDGDRLFLTDALPASARQRLGVIPEHRVGECLCGLAVSEGRPLYSRDIFNDSRCTWEECRQAGLKSFAALPLRSGDEIIGVIGLASGAERDFEAQGKFLETLAGQVSVALANARLYEALQKELAERKRGEEALRTLNRELERSIIHANELTVKAEAANYAKSEFLATMSHELRTPLNAIIGFTNLTLASEVTDKQRNYLEIVSKRALDLLAIIKDILDLVKIETDKMEFADEEIDIGRIIREAVETVELDAKSKNLSVQTSIAPDIPRVLKGDSLRLKQIIINLVGNAVKFTERGEIRISVTRQPSGSSGLSAPPANTQHTTNKLLFSVSDTGIGIPADKRKMIFEAFSQVESSYTRNFGGAGLGLAICTRLVAKMGGDIWVESEPGKGSTFFFTLSLHEATAAAGESLGDAESAPSKEVTRRLRILVADDDPLTRQLATILLAEHGHDLTVVGSGGEAVEMAARHFFDIVLLDIRMPGLNGIETVREIRRLEAAGSLPDARGKRARLPIIAFTAFAMSGDREAFLAAGMDGYISKPLQGDTLLSTIHTVLTTIAATS